MFLNRGGWDKRPEWFYYVMQQNGHFLIWSYCLISTSQFINIYWHKYIHPMDRSSRTLIGLIFFQLNPSWTSSWLPFKINTIFQIKLHILHPLGVYCNSDSLLVQLEPRSLTLAEVRLLGSSQTRRPSELL